MQRQGRVDVPTYSYVIPQQESNLQRSHVPPQQPQPYQPSMYVSNQTIYHQAQQQQSQPYKQSMNQPYSHQQSMYVSNEKLYQGQVQQRQPYRSRMNQPYTPIMNQQYTHQQSQFLNSTQAAPNNIRHTVLINVPPQQSRLQQHPTDNKLRQVENQSTQTSSTSMFESDALILQLRNDKDGLRKIGRAHV